MAAAETPDTPRAVSRRGGRAFAQQAIVINSLLPNAVPMVNGGMEVYERQPMNLGLDAKPKDRRALSKRDPFYGKLAFFDRYVLHWTTTGADDMIELIAEAAAIRRRFLDALTASRAYFAPHVATGRKWTLATGYRLDARQGILLMLANVDTDKAHRTSITGLRTRRTRPEVLLQTQGSAPPTVRRGKLSMRLDPAVVMIV
jgi:starch synthase (maltosyl-transferring)